MSTSKPTSPGRLQVQGLQSAAVHNGQAGRVVSWNADGNRRYGVRLDATGKLLNVKARNLLPLDAVEWRADFPEGFESGAFCVTLQAELRHRYSQAKVLDWTPLAATMQDVTHLLFLAHSLVDEGMGPDSKVVIFVARTGATAPFFLAHRELLLQYVLGTKEVPTMPWILFMAELAAIPPQWEHSCQPKFMRRFCLHVSSPTQQCVICLEEKITSENPNQLPCVHFICELCLPKTFPPLSRAEYFELQNMPTHQRVGRTGLRCPVCRYHFKGHCVVPSTASGKSGRAAFNLVEFIKRG
jgi:hypothetical protein